MKFKPGDIVEILNLSSSQIYDIQSQTCKFGREKALRDSIVGSRYEIDWASESTGYHLKGWNHGGHSAAYFEESQLMLFKAAEQFSDALILYSICRANMREVANFRRGNANFPGIRGRKQISRR